MEKYKDIDWDSWIIEYEIWENYIKVKFNTNVIYTYSYISAWSLHIENMKKLAIKWDWLNYYIKRNKVPYSHKI